MNEWPATIVAIATISALISLSIVAIRHYKTAEEAMRVITTLIGVFGAGVGGAGMTLSFGLAERVVSEMA